ncbi:hypothetical protein GYMLUDRAFT_39666 [Collybiopsis luxurians FD-317 M1]|nr:hypothetical protein GYMLUDRAFT_39666 [Collybiopsis luxurians FD-317 M1]
MPTKPSPKIYQILIRTHKTTIFLTVPPSTTLSSLKESALAALSSFDSHSSSEPEPELESEHEEGPPKITSTDEFNLCRVINVKPSREPRTQGQVQKREYEVLGDEDVDPEGGGGNATIQELRLGNWEVLYVQFKDDKGKPLPIVATDPPIDDEEDASSMPPPPPPPLDSPVPSSPSKGKGKRKAISDDEEYED